MQEKLEKSLIYEPLVNQIFPYLSPPFEVPFLECSKTWCKIFGIRDNQLVSFLKVAEANNVMGKEFSPYLKRFSILIPRIFPCKFL